MNNSKLRGFKQTTKPEKALAVLLNHVTSTKLDSERIPLERSLGRILAKDIASNVDVPAFDRAAMDGYAVIAEDTFGSSQTSPAILGLVGKIDMGVPPVLKVAKGEAAEITTGAALPAGADAVVMLEYTRRISPKQIEILTAVTPQENVSKSGEDVRKGDLVLGAGTRLKPPDIGMLAALAQTEIDVVRAPRIAILCTGNELIEPIDAPQKGKIVNSNRFLLSAMTRQLGGSDIYLGIAKDSLENIKDLICKGVREADIVLITGGTSVGETDLVPEAIQLAGRPGMLVHGVSMRPGMPTGLASVDGKPVISLPGQPIAAMMSFNMFVRPLIHCLLGAEEEPIPFVKAKLSRRVASTPGMKTFLRVIVKEERGNYIADPITTTGSALLSSMTQANGLVTIPEDKEGIEEGEEATVVLFRSAKRDKHD